MCGGVAKLVIAPACQAGGRGFKSRRSRMYPAKGFFFRAVAQGLARSVRDREVGGSNPPSPKYLPAIVGGVEYFIPFVITVYK